MRIAIAILMLGLVTSGHVFGEDHEQLPSGPAPHFAMVRLPKTESPGVHVAIYDEHRDSKTGLVYFMNMVSAPLRKMTVYDGAGKKLSTAEAEKRLTDGMLVLRSADGKPVDPKYLKLLNKDVLVFLAQPELNIPSD